MIMPDLSLHADDEIIANTDNVFTRTAAYKETREESIRCSLELANKRKQVVQTKHNYWNFVLFPGDDADVLIKKMIELEVPTVEESLLRLATSEEDAIRERKCTLTAIKALTALLVQDLTTDKRNAITFKWIVAVFSAKDIKFSKIQCEILYKFLIEYHKPEMPSEEQFNNPSDFSDHQVHSISLFLNGIDIAQNHSFYPNFYFMPRVVDHALSQAAKQAVKEEEAFGLTYR
jgi:hypothetical protein